MKKFNVSQWAWISYDFANSAFHLLIPTILFPLLYKSVLVTNTSNSDLIWSIIVSLPVLIVGITAPFIGAYIDNKRNNRFFFILVTSSTILLNFMLGLISPDFGPILILFFATCMMFFNYSQFSYDAFLPSQKQGKGVATLSGIGWGLGYLGGIVCMVPVMYILHDKTLPEDYSSYQVAFLFVASFYLVFTLWSFFKIKGDNTQNTSNIISTPYKKVFSTLKNWRKNKHIFLFLIAFYFINDGLSTLVYFTSIFASTTLHMDAQEILKAFLFVQVIGVPATIIFCRLSEKIGYMTMFVATVLLWIFISVGFLLVATTTGFYVLSFIVGLVIGTTPAMGRAIISTYLSKRSDSVEIFGFNALSSRISAILGPTLFGIIATISGSQKIGLVSLVLFFTLGLFVLYIKKKYTPNPSNKN